VDNLVVHGDFNDIQLGDMPSKVVAADFSAIASAAGWNVIEVQNGNDPAQVVAALDKADSLIGKGKPIFICYYTTMGYGIDFMEEGSNSGNKNYHGAPLSEEEAERATKELTPLDDAISQYKSTHESEKKRYEKNPPTETNIKLSWDVKKLSGYERTPMEEKGAARKEIGALHIKNLMKADDRIIVLHADIAGSGGFDKVAKDFPDRVINVGVAEANMLMMASGLRQVGLLPVTYTFAAFSTNEARASARLIDINCGHTRCGIINDCTHSGLSVGEDGETHQEQNYLNIPFYHTQVWMPADSNQAGAMVEKSFELIADGKQSVYIFSARSGHEQLKTPNGDLLYGKEFEYNGKIDLIRGSGDTNDDVTILAVGIGVHDAVAAADELASAETPIKVRVLNVSCVRPIDSAAVIEAALETGRLIVVEDHNSDGGLATQVADIIADFALPCSLRRLGLSHYFPSATANDLKFMAGLDIESIVNSVEDAVHTEICGGEDAFVTSIFELLTNLRTSRFKTSAQPFVDKLIAQKEYLPQLRKYWGVRTSSPDQLPSNEDLLERLENTSPL